MPFVSGIGLGTWRSRRNPAESGPKVSETQERDALTRIKSRARLGISVGFESMAGAADLPCAQVGQGFNLYATGSTAYAISARGAAALLAEPFSHNADHWLELASGGGDSAKRVRFRICNELTVIGDGPALPHIVHPPRKSGLATDSGRTPADVGQTRKRPSFV